jgi:MraZ protein
MFLGQYVHNLDSKGRVIIPARFRDQLDGSVYVTQGFDRNLRLLPEDAFERIYARVTAMNSTDPVARQLRRLIFSSAQKVNLDSNGRVLIPKYLREFAGLEEEVVIVGVGEAIEMWSPEAWENENSLLNDTEANAQRFAALEV